MKNQKEGIKQRKSIVGMLSLLVIFATSCSEGVVATLQIASCPIEVENQFTIEAPCEWIGYSDQSPNGDGVNGMLHLDGGENLSYMTGELAFSSLADIKASGTTLFTATYALENALLLVIEEEIDGTIFLHAYIESFDKSQKARFWIKESDRRDEIVEALKTFKF